MLINCGADPSLGNKKNLNVLHFAAQGDKPFSLVMFRYNYKNVFENINICDSESSSPLHWACFCNSHNIINFLLALGAKTNLQDSNGNTSLHIALKSFDWKD